MPKSKKQKSLGRLKSVLRWQDEKNLRKYLIRGNHPSRKKNKTHTTSQTPGRGRFSGLTFLRGGVKKRKTKKRRKTKRRGKRKRRKSKRKSRRRR